MDFEFDPKDIVNARIDRKKKIPATTILYSLGYDSEEILSMFYKSESISKHKDGWKKDFIPENITGGKSLYFLLSQKVKLLSKRVKNLHQDYESIG